MIGRSSYVDARSEICPDLPAGRPLGEGHDPQFAALGVCARSPLLSLHDVLRGFWRPPEVVGGRGLGCVDPWSTVARRHLHAEHEDPLPPVPRGDVSDGELSDESERSEGSSAFLINLDGTRHVHLPALRVQVLRHTVPSA